MFLGMRFLAQDLSFLLGYTEVWFLSPISPWWGFGAWCRRCCSDGRAAEEVGPQHWACTSVGTQPAFLEKTSDFLIPPWGGQRLRTRWQAGNAPRTQSGSVWGAQSQALEMVWMGTGGSLGQVCSAAASSRAGSLQAPAGAQPSPLRASAAGSRGFIFSPASTCSVPLKTICCLQWGWFVGFESTKQNPSHFFHFLAANREVFHVHLLPSAPMCSPHPPVSILDEMFWAGSDPSLSFVLQSGQSAGMPGSDSDTDWGCSQGCPSPVGGVPDV